VNEFRYARESNPGFVARPLVAFNNGPGGVKSIAPADRALVEGGEMTRAYIDAQNAWARTRSGRAVL
jgi:hypothetical protein